MTASVRGPEGSFDAMAVGALSIVPLSTPGHRRGHSHAPGDLSSAITVDYATSDGTASERSDYTTAVGTVRFAAGETSKTFTVLLADDVSVEPDESITLTLSNTTGGGGWAR